MSICAYGSSAKAGYTPYVWLKTADLTSGPNGSWWLYVLSLLPFTIENQLVDVAAFCMTEVAPPPALTLGDVLSMLPNPSQWVKLRESLTQLALSELWATQCVCNAGGTPVTTCFDVLNVTGITTNQVGMSWGPFTLNSGIQTLTWDFHDVTASARWTCRIMLFDDAACTLNRFDPSGSDAIMQADQHRNNGSVSMAGHTQRYLKVAIVIASPDTGTLTGSIQVQQCYPATVATPPPFPNPTPLPPGLPVYPTPTACSTDELCKRLDRLENLAIRGSDLLTLVQRQGVPFAYIPGPVFSGLTGNGEVAVSGILAASVDASDHPLVSVEFGHPSERYDQGWVNLGDADGWFERVQLGPRPTFIPSVPAYVTKIGYSLPPGVTATLRTWKREAS